MQPLVTRSAQSIASIPELTAILIEIINHVSFELVTRTDTVLILSYLASIEMEPNVVRGDSAPEIIQCLSILLSTLPSLEYYEEFQHALVHCLRNLISTELNQAIFLNEKGLDILLELIRKSSPSITENALNLMLQMSTNKQVHTFVQCQAAKC